MQPGCDGCSSSEDAQQAVDGLPSWLYSNNSAVDRQKQGGLVNLRGRQHGSAIAALQHLSCWLSNSDTNHLHFPRPMSLQRCPSRGRGLFDRCAVRSTILRHGLADSTPMRLFEQEDQAQRRRYLTPQVRLPSRRPRCAPPQKSLGALELSCTQHRGTQCVRRAQRLPAACRRRS